jgi:hypothetical protein
MTIRKEKEKKEYLNKTEPSLNLIENTYQIMRRKKQI